MGSTDLLSAGRSYLAIPGPSVMPDSVLQAMHRPSPNLYGGELLELTESVIPALARVARTKHNVAIYIANGHGAWEAALSNTWVPGDRVLVPASGAFARGWGDMAAGLGVEVEVLDFGLKAPFDFGRIADVLAADKSHSIKAVLGVHVDTSTSIRNDISALRTCLDEAGHPALLMADCIASLGCDPFEMDDWGGDVRGAGCQKGLMVPAGVSFVFFNDKAAAVRTAQHRQDSPCRRSMASEGRRRLRPCRRRQLHRARRADRRRHGRDHLTTPDAPRPRAGASPPQEAPDHIRGCAC